MADLVIRGMEMPKDWDLWLCIDTGGTVYNVKPVITGTAQEVGTAIPLPEGHGRLIDADTLIENHFSDEHRIALSPADKLWMRRIIRGEPTIIEAEGGTDECSEN